MKHAGETLAVIPSFVRVSTFTHDTKLCGFKLITTAQSSNIFAANDTNITVYKSHRFLCKNTSSGVNVL